MGLAALNPSDARTRVRVEGAMKEELRAAVALTLGALVAGVTTVHAGDVPPAWAYGFTVPLAPGTPPAEPNPQQALDNVTLHALPGSKSSFTRAQISNRYGPADWFPEDHPAMPEIVARGKEFAQPSVYALACAIIPTATAGPRTPTSRGSRTNTSCSR